MNFLSRITIASQTCPGVAFTLNKMTEGRRIQLRFSLSLAQSRLADLMKQRLDAFVASDVFEVNRLDDQVLATVQEDINPAYLKWGLHAIDGLTIDGAPASVESIYAEGPPELVAEILGAIRLNMGLSEVEEKNSQSPITSEAAEDGRMNDTTAENAGSGDTTQLETVPSTSPLSSIEQRQSDGLPPIVPQRDRRFISAT